MRAGKRSRRDLGMRALELWRLEGGGGLIKNLYFLPKGGYSTERGLRPKCYERNHLRQTKRITQIPYQARKTWFNISRRPRGGHELQSGLKAK